MQVHHETPDGSRAIVSFLIEDDRDAENNIFIDQVQPEFWITNEGYHHELDNLPNLNNIVRVNAK